MSAWTTFERPSLRCRACGCWQTSNVNALTGDGPPQVEIALVGEAPGEWEEAQEANFVGRAGEMLNGCLTEAGVLRAEVFVCNAVRCRPVTPQRRNRKPTMHEIDCCRGYTLDELASVKPRVIVALGDVAMTSLIGKQLGGVTEHRGKVRWSDEWNAWVIATFHPAYALRKYAERHWIVEDLRLARQVVERGGPAPVETTRVDVIRTLDDAFRMRDVILGYDEVAFDWETNGVHLTKSRGFCVSFAVREGHAFVVPRYLSQMTPCWSKSELRTLDHDVLIPILLSELRKIGWHLAFDNNISRTTLGIWPTNPWFCGMIAHHALANHLGGRAHGLKICASMYTPMGRYDDPLDQWLVEHGYTDQGKPDYGKVWLAPDEITHLYNGSDSDAALRLKNVFVPRLHEAKLWKIFTTDLMPVSTEHQEIDRIGVRINRPYLDELSGLLGSALDTMHAELAGYADDPELNPSSHKQMGELFFDTLGLPILGRTDTGQPSTREEILVQLKEMHPAVPLLLAYRAHEKIKSTYVDGKDTAAGRKKALRAVIDDDGYARMNTLLAVAETFRFITRRPFAIHTWPKTDPKSGIPSVRALIIPDDGYVFLTRDYCVTPETRVLCADLTWKRADELTLNQELVGFDEDLSLGQKHKYRRANVQSLSRLRLPCYRIVTNKGEVIASGEHAWVARKPTAYSSAPYGTRRWIKSKDLKPGDAISFMCQPWTYDASRDAGELAGFLNGEGSAGAKWRQLSFAQNPGSTLRRVLALLRERGFDPVLSRSHSSGPRAMCQQWNILGLGEQLRLLGSLRPSRLFEHAYEYWEGRRTWSQSTPPAEILSVEYVGEREVIGFQTSTRTFIAEGFLSHNTQQEFVIQSIVAGQWDMVEALLDRGEDVHEKVTRELGGHEKSSYLWTPDFGSAYVEIEGERWKGKDAFDEYKKQRQKFKNVNFMILFRGGARKLARMALGCTADYRTRTPCKLEGVVDCSHEQQAAQYISDYYELYDAIKWWQYHTIKTLAQTGKVVGVFDTYRTLPGIWDSNAYVRLEAERQGCNFPIQNGGAHVMRRALLRTQARFRGKPPLRAAFPGRVVFTLHDELTAQVREDLIDEGDYIVRTCMEAPYPELGGRSFRTSGVTTTCWGG